MWIFSPPLSPFKLPGHMECPSGFESPTIPWQGTMLPLHYGHAPRFSGGLELTVCTALMKESNLRHLTKMVLPSRVMGGMIGVEPTFMEPQSIVLPLDDIPHIQAVLIAYGDRTRVLIFVMIMSYPLDKCMSLSAFAVTALKYRHRESNPDLQIRSLLPCPLCYTGLCSKESRHNWLIFLLEFLSKSTFAADMIFHISLLNHNGENIF